MRRLLAASVCAFAAGVATSDPARAQSNSVVDICTGLSVNLPVLQPIAGVTSGLLAGLLDPVLNGVVGDVNLKLRDALSGRNIGLTAIDQNGNLVTAPGQCGVKADRVQVESAGGIAIGGGMISGLGSTASPTASAADQNAIAFGHGASTNVAATGAVAIGLRGAVTAADGVALGRDAAVTAAGGIALGAGSVGLRAGLGGGTEAFSGVATASARGALSVGSAGNERQIVNVAGGTQATDAVNLRQLRAVATGLSTSLGGGAGFDANGVYTGPTYVLRSGTFSDVGSALNALDQSIVTPPPSGPGIITGNNTSNRAAAAATGADAMAAGFGATALGSRGTALGTGATAISDGGIALGAGSIAQRAGLSGAREAFSAVAVGSSQGALSVGSAGNERQIVNVAGGTQATDAVNLRQLRAVGSNLSTALGGGAGFDGDGSFTGPSYALRGGIYGDVGSALAALDRAGGVIAGNNTSRYATASASGPDALAAGYGASASGSRATALGTGASATAEGSTALGAGASATRARQVAIGTAASTYTLPGVTSSASRAAQSGPTQLVTTDAAGNLATTPIDLGAMNQRIGALGERVDALGAYAQESRKEARQGVAAAMAMSAAAMPSRPGKTSWNANTATYKGEWAAGFSVAHRLDVAIPIALNAGVSLNGSSFAGARVGVNGEF